MAVSKSINDADALLVFSVGPVLCCAPALTVETVMMPPALHKPPGTDRNNPGVFHHPLGMVSVVDLRQRFGVEESDWRSPGRMVVTEISGGHAGFMVDEIMDVMQWPQQGWGKLPALVPREVFKKTLLLKNQIHLYADFDDLYKFRESGYLRAHIAMLVEKQKQVTDIQKTHATPITQDVIIPPAEITQPVRPEPSITFSSRETIAPNPINPHRPVESSPSLQHRHVPAINQKPTGSRLTSASGASLSRHTDTAARPKTTRPVAVTRQSEVPVTAAVEKFPFAENQVELARTDASNKNASGIYLIFGILFLLLVALVLVMTSFNQDRVVVADRSATAITAPVSMPVEIEPGFEPEPGPLPVPVYQASVSQDAEGIVITIDAADELLEQKADSDSTNVIRNDETPADTALNLATPIPAAKEKIIVHVVVKGDTLWDIAKRYVRNPWRYPELAKLSNIKNPHRIYPGNKVKIIMRTAAKTE